jgi:tetratricopeptide (TPR) repeat protein/HEAT repeat protein
MVRRRGPFFTRYPAILFWVRRPVTLAALVAVAAGAPPARADWQVRGHDRAAVVDQAARALAERPDDDALARRLVATAGKAGQERLRAQFHDQAEAAPPRYAAVAAYAQLALALHDFDEAARAFDRALKLRPASGPALAGKALALASGGKHAEALEAFDQALRRDLAPRERRRLLAAELGLLAPEDLEREIEVRRALCALDPRDDAAAERLADALERAGRPAEAADVLEARIPSGRAAERLDLALRAAMLRDAGGDSAKAAAALSALLRQLPPSASDRRREVWTRAIEVARNANTLPALAGELARAPGAVEWEMLSRVRDELGDLEGALEAGNEAQARQRQNVELGRRIVALLERLGREEEATAAYEALARMAPREPRWAVELVEREFRLHQRKLAEDHFDRAAARFADNPAGLAQLAELASRWGQDRRALAAWERVRRLDPRNELAILGLGEVQFQRGHKDAALRAWQALRDKERVPAAGHLRYAEVLLEHDLALEALVEVQRAQALDPKQTRPHRLMAEILERQRKLSDAVREWEIVLAMSAGPTGAAERHEARARILALLARESRGQLQARIRRLEDEVRRNPGDREQALFLTEAQQRDGNVPGAIATLRGIVERDTQRGGSSGPPATPGEAQPAPVSDDARAEVVLTLVRLLRRTGQIDEAVRRLEDLARLVPARARDAYVQIADIKLGRYDESGALAHAERAARLAPGDGQTLARIAEIEERAGDDGRALTTYRQAFARDGNPAAAFALARLLERRGQAREAADVLRQLLRTATDDEVVAEAGRRAIEVEEYIGRLAELERVVGGAIFSGQKGPAYRRVLVEVLRHLLPALYRADPGDAAAAEERTRIAQHGLRPLLELLTESEEDPDRTLIELLGMLGNRDAAPALARIAEAPGRIDRARVATAAEAQLAAVIALGRLGDERGREVLETLAAAPDAGMRAVAVWALGRIGEARSSPALVRALQDPRSDVAAMACLGVGRSRDGRAVTLLADVAADSSRPLRLRRAAIAGLALAGDRAATPALLALAETGDEELERAAAVALGTLRDPRALGTLLARALAPAHGRDADSEAALAALDTWAGGATLTDEARAIEGNRLEVDALLAALLARPPAADRGPLWIDRRPEIQQALGAALEHGGPARTRALEALDGRSDGPGLSPLAPGGDAPLPAPAAQAIREVAGALRGRVAPLLDDPDPRTQALALRVLAKTGDARVTPARVAAALGSRAEAPREAAAWAVRWAAHTAPESLPALAHALAGVLAEAGPWESRLAAVAALAEVGPAGAAALERALADESPLVRAAAAEALAPADGATSVLAAAAGDPVAAVRAAVALALRNRQAPAAHAALERLARDDSLRVRRAATELGQAPPARP